MRLGIDFDGVIADTPATKIRYALETFGEVIEAAETFGPLGRARLGDERYVEMVQAAHQDWTHRTPPMPGALEAMRELAARHELYIVTARTDAEMGPAQDWLRAFDVPSATILHTSSATKVDACQAHNIELVIDDLPLVLHELAEAGIRGALLDAAYNRDIARHERVHLVRSWGEFVALAERLGTPAARRG